MTTIQLAYGRDALEFDFDPNRFHVLKTTQNRRQALSDAEIGAAFDAPIDSPPLDSVIQSGDSVLIVASDATRATGSAQFINLLVRRFIEIGTAPADIAIIFATGIHRLVRPEEATELLTPFIAQRIRTIDHDPYDALLLIELANDETCAAIKVNRALKEFDKVILTGGIAFHYFAGFTGGRKAICPGLASAETIEATHMLALDFERGGRRAGVGPGLLDGNAVNLECERAAALIEPAFSIQTIVNDRGQPEKVFTGHWRGAHRHACEVYASDHSVLISEKRDIVIVSCGGAPYDINLIQAHKALDMAAQACVEGGTIIFLAECADGLGRADFLEWFDSEDSRALESRLREAYKVNGQTAWALLTKTERFRVYIVTSLTDPDVARMRMIPARSIKEVVAKLSSTQKGYIMPRGAALLPIIQKT